ncbi:MAG TPA: helix-turn-helix domain-containing protein, partial [bacterium]|nr:helix-turn-helix domain-containing protein [bacterium]
MDMYYRLHVVPIKVPPLRDYKDDIPNLIENFIREANANFKTSVKRVNKKALSALMQYDYPGNVRQLRNVINQAVIMADGDTIKPEDIPAEIFSVNNENSEAGDVIPCLENETGLRSYHAEKEKMMEKFTREYFSALLRHSGGNMAATAKTAGISRVALYKIFKKFGISDV